MTPIPQRPSDREWSWSRNKRFLSDLAFDSSKESAFKAKHIFYVRWNSILENYASRKMTNSSDVFPALAGLASEFNFHLHDDYVAGLWNADLHRGLLWRTIELETVKEAHPYRAPSWSRASKVGSISGIRDADYIIGNYRADIKATVTHKGAEDALEFVNPYGEISSGFLSIRGRGISATNWPTFESKPWEHSFIQNPEDSNGYLVRDFDTGKEDSVMARREKGWTLTLIQIATWAWGASPDDGGALHCLILESGDEGDNELYSRVGVAQLYAYPNTWTDRWEVCEFIVV